MTTRFTLIGEKLAALDKKIRLGDKENRQNIEKVAISAFTFLAGEPQYFSRFLQLSGVETADLAEISGEPGFLTAVLEYVVSDESLLGAFCQHHGYTPTEVDRCYQLMNGHDAFR